ncbi:MAG: HD-GYP domain-containing protein [Clostridia bacterium]|nr:HD-GYP domain-containing protein [Clostridia bacterium]
MKNKKPASLLGKFSLLSFLVLFILGGILDYDITRFVTRNFIDIYKENYNQAINATISLIFEPEDFRQPLNDENKKRLDMVFRRMVSIGNVKEFKIWSPEAKMIYSSQSLPKDDRNDIDEIKQVLTGQPIAKIIEKDGSEHDVKWFHRNDDAIEFYLPITYLPSNEIISVFEVYIDTKNFVNRMAVTKRYLAIAILGSFLILYITLFQIVRTASKTITQQDYSLRNLSQRLNATLHDQVEAHVGTIQALLAALDAKDHYTAGHSTRVADLAVNLGRHIGLANDRLKLLEEAALFHDIGKIGIPETLLSKKTKLNQEEFDDIKLHPDIGARIINTMNSFSEHSLLIRHHHERYDGKGYPDGLKGDEIPLESRILAVADTFDALVSDRPYRKRISTYEAIPILRYAGDSQLDPDLVEEFIKIIS